LNEEDLAQYFEITEIMNYESEGDLQEFRTEGNNRNTVDMNLVGHKYISPKMRLSGCLALGLWKVNKSKRIIRPKLLDQRFYPRSLLYDKMAQVQVC